MLQTIRSARIPNVAPKDLITLRYNAKPASLSFVHLFSIRTNPYFIMVALVIHRSPSARKKKHTSFISDDVPTVVIIKLAHALIEALAKTAPKYPGLYPKTMLPPVNKAAAPNPV